MLRVRCRLWIVCAALSLSSVLPKTSGLAQVSRGSFGTLQEGARTIDIDWNVGASTWVDRASITLEAGGRLSSTALSLRPLRLYEVRTTMRRDPGLQVRFQVVYVDEHGAERRWSAIWQSAHAGRPDWLPVAPLPQDYVQGFVMPLGASNARIELSADVPTNGVRVEGARWHLGKLALVASTSIACCEATGPNRLLGGDMETPARDDLPIGWAQWGAREMVQTDLLELSDPAHHHVIRVKAGKGALLASTAEVPVAPGSAWRISFKARGHGTISSLAHPLGDGPIRVGDPQLVPFQISSQTWQELDAVWFAEAPGTRLAQVLLQINAERDLEIDDVKFLALVASRPRRKAP